MPLRLCDLINYLVPLCAQKSPRNSFWHNPNSELALSLGLSLCLNLHLRDLIIVLSCDNCIVMDFVVPRSRHVTAFGTTQILSENGWGWGGGGGAEEEGGEIGEGYRLGI